MQIWEYQNQFLDFKPKALNQNFASHANSPPCNGKVQMTYLGYTHIKGFTTW